MSESLVRTEVRDHIATISLNRPAKHNALNYEMMDQLLTAIAELYERSDLRVGILRGEGPSLCSGKDLGDLSAPDSSEEHFNYSERSQRRIGLFRTMPFPMIAALKGWAIGVGFELALTCDMRVAADDAKMTLPEVKHGVVPDCGGVARLFQIGGPGLASDMAFGGRVLTAAEALTLGVVRAVVTPDELDGRVVQLAEEIAAMPPFAVRMSRRIVMGLGSEQFERTVRAESIAQAVAIGVRDAGRVPVTSDRR